MHTAQTPPRPESVRARAATDPARSATSAGPAARPRTAARTGTTEGLFPSEDRIPAADLLPSEELFRSAPRSSEPRSADRGRSESRQSEPAELPRSADSASRAGRPAPTFDRTFGALIAEPEAGAAELPVSRPAVARSAGTARPPASRRPGDEAPARPDRRPTPQRSGARSEALFPAEPALPSESLFDAEAMFAPESRAAAAPEPTIRTPRPPLDPRIGSVRSHPDARHQPEPDLPEEPEYQPEPEAESEPRPEARVYKDPLHRLESRSAAPEARSNLRTRPGQSAGGRTPGAGKAAEEPDRKRDGSLQVDANLLPTIEVEPIKINGLSKQFDDNWAVRDLSFTVAPGRVTGLLGPTGAGKTTTLRMLVGLTRPTSGTATFGDHGYAALRHPQRMVGTVLGRNFHPRHSGRDHLRVAAATAGVSDDQVDDLLYLVGLSDAANRPADSYSLGMQQRLAIAGALLGEPEYLILDEPAIGLDPDGIRWLRGFLRSFAATGRAVLISSHLLNDAQRIVDDVVVIRDGRLINQINMADLAGSQGTTRLRVDDVSAARAALADVAETLVCGDEEGRYLRVLSQDVAEIGFRLYRSDVIVYELVREELNLEQLFFSALEGAA